MTRDADDQSFYAAIATQPAALESLLAEHFGYRTTTGSIIGKRALIDRLTRGETRVTEPVIYEYERHRSGDTTVSSGRVRLIALEGIQRIPINASFLHVWVREAAVWRLAWRESTILA